MKCLEIIPKDNNGRRHGLRIIYHGDINCNIWYRTNYNHGIKEGLGEHFTKEGKLWELTYYITI